jgi:hypothetical protein
MKFFLLFCLLISVVTAQWGHKDPMRPSVVDYKRAYPYGPDRYWPGFVQGQRYHSKKAEPLPHSSSKKFVVPE